MSGFFCSSISSQGFFKQRKTEAAAPLVAAVEAIDLQLVCGAQGSVDSLHSDQCVLGPVRLDQAVVQTGLPDAGPRGNQRADLGCVAVFEQAGDDSAPQLYRTATRSCITFSAPETTAARIRGSSAEVSIVIRPP